MGSDPEALQGQQAQGSKRGWFIRRQATSLPTSAQAVAGVSSFAYQGTNSHVVAATICQTQATVQARTIWHHRRFWYQVRTYIAACEARIDHRIAQAGFFWGGIE